jgi:hypothetical protein
VMNIEAHPPRYSSLIIPRSAFPAVGESGAGGDKLALP